MKDRSLIVSNYFGLAPWVWWHNRANPEKQAIVQHSQQALALSGLLLGCLVVFGLCFGLQQIILFASRDLFELLPLEITFYILGILLFLWLILWLWGLSSALRQRWSQVPLTAWIISKTGWLWLAALWTLFLQVSVIAALAITLHATLIMQAAKPQAEVYLLYDDMGYIPEEVFASGFYRVALAAQEKWGVGSVTLRPLTAASLQQALQTGRFVYVASHGAEGRIFLDQQTSLGPEDIKLELIGAALQYVYLSGCDTGYLADDWQRVLAPAEVKTFDRLSATSEHIIWLLLEGPRIISGLQD